MPPLENDHIYFDDDAGEYAFRAGQLLEKILLERGLDMARKSQVAIVRSETIELCVDQLLLDQLRKQLHERAKQGSRKVA
jgi:hypothetical protein